MADPQPPAPPPPAPATSGAATALGPSSTYKAPKPNPVLRMMGLPNLPTKLPGRNWLIFWAVTATFTGAVVYDKREKKRATARWSHAVSHLGKEPIQNPGQLPRKLTIYLEAAPWDTLRVSQDHFTEYVKPVLAASGLDWEFVQGRQQGDVRAAVAEKIRRQRRADEGGVMTVTNEEELTKDEIIKAMRKRNQTPESTDVQGDIVIGRHAWKEYIRGLHEGWLGPLTAPAPPAEPAQPAPTSPEPEKAEGETTTEEEKKEEKKKEEKPSRPPQPVPYNSPDDYAAAALPRSLPSELGPSAPIPFPHVLGFMGSLTRLHRFLNRRYLADDIGREVAAACLAHARAYENGEDPAAAEQLAVLAHEEKDWHKGVWKELEREKKPAADGSSGSSSDEGEAASGTAELVWPKPMVLDPRLAGRMQRFVLHPDDEARARAAVIPEEQVEGWIKGSLRALYRWAVSDPPPKPWSSDDKW